eukprot:5740531-Pleurochrysis_carterae.AAC.3
MILSNDRRKAIGCVSLRCNYEGKAKLRVAWRGKLTLPKSERRPLSTYSKGACNIGKSKVEAVMAIGMCKPISGVSSVHTFPVAQINSQPAIHGQCEDAEGS